MVLCVMLARAPRIAGDSSIIYGAGDCAAVTLQRRLPVSSATANLSRIGR